MFSKITLGKITVQKIKRGVELTTKDGAYILLEKQYFKAFADMLYLLLKEKF